MPGIRRSAGRETGNFLTESGGRGMSRMMPRAPRCLIQNGIFHITIRGNNRQKIFADSSDYTRYLGLLRVASQRYAVALLAYALMPNHVHLLIRDGAEALPNFMRLLNLSYTKHFNSRHQRIGRLYQSRYYARLVAQDAYLLEVTRYIHLNPVKAHLVRRPGDYPWSSYRAFIGLEPADGIDPSIVLDQFSEEETRASVRYRTFVETLAVEQLPDVEKRLRRLGLIGSARIALQMQREKEKYQVLPGQEVPGT